MLKDLAILLQRRFPVYLILEVTSRCNLKCRHCFNWRRQESVKAAEELTLEEFRRLSANLRSIYYLSVTGGEPTLRDDLPDIVSQFCKTNRVRVINLHTNGFDTGTIVSQVERILSARNGSFLRVSVSIDDVGSVHDDIRGVAGSYDRAKATIERLAEVRSRTNSMSVEVASVVSTANAATFPNIYSTLVDSLPVDLVNIALVRGDSREEAYKNVPLDQYESIIRFKNQYLDKHYPKKGLLARGQKALNQITNLVSLENIREKTQVVPCQAGSRGIQISSTGDVFPCEMLDFSFGNLRQSDFDIKEMLLSPKAREIRAFIRARKCYCSFECMIPLSIVYSPRSFPRLLNYMFR